MNRREVAQLACRILAIWFFCQVALSLEAVALLLISFVNDPLGRIIGPSDMAFLILPGMTAIGSLVIGLLLWWKSGGIASKMAPADPAPITSKSLDQKSLLAVAFAAIGAFVAVKVLPYFGRTLYMLVRGSKSFSELWVSLDFQATFLSDIFQILLAMWLIFGAKGIAGMVRQFRSFGVVEPGKDGRNGNSPPKEGEKH
jgi:hypothetical protein